ncbi:endospore germination permease [Bacillus sp. V3B]|uniref:GerAB/ArcD/ProY family transporter n=1 Tax=Bacillus sp. V3B TaxID=2804915 RepID=UPI0021091EFA|nr:endospore germination permease [Bacillus sp. V3B]MCQ6275977.1 endospore germination permease [Bacillus sp. V3B]
MIEKGKISSMQMGIMLYPTIIATAILSAPSGTVQYAKNDMWLSPIWASLGGFLAVYIAHKLHKLYPKQTVIQYSERILGKILGKSLGFILIIVNLLVTDGLIIRQYTEVVVGVFLPQTPMFVVTASLVLVCGFAVRGGLEVVGRSAELFIPLYIFSLVIIIALLIPEFNPSHIFPIMENGLIPSIKGAISPLAMFSLFFNIAYLLPYLTDEEKGMKWSMISVCAVMATLVMLNITTIFVLGGTTGNFVYPVLSAARYISVADLLENLETIVMALWVAGTFIKVSVMYYVTVLATAQLLGLSDSRFIVFPIGLLIVLFSFWGIPNFVEVAKFMRTISPLYASWFNVAIPILLLLIAVIRRKLKKKDIISADH